MVFEKAARKVKECNYFAIQLGRRPDGDAPEFLFNAVLSSGKNVVNAIQAAISVAEGVDAAGKGKERAQESYARLIKSWKRTSGPMSATLFDVLQALRDIEMHANRSAFERLPRTVERKEPRTIPDDASYRAVFASYMAMGLISPDTTLYETTYDLLIRPVAPSRGRVARLLKHYAKGRPQSLHEIGASYVTLLTSLVAHCESHYHRTTPPLHAT